MKAEELMIGDLVLQCELNAPVKVHSIMRYYADENVYFYHETREYISNISKLEPIPLTEEILHKNGFKNDVLAQKSIIAEGASNFSVILISEDNRITINNIEEYLNSFNKWYIHIDTEDMRTLCVAEITYVHELQHILKLCGIKKEIIV